jgi:ubiquinone/menaquinone biosynthesis C-methylase UbiE
MVENMNPIFQNIFIDPKNKLPLQYEGDIIKRCWTNGVLKDAHGCVVSSVVDRIPSFISSEKDSWGDQQAVSREFEKYGVKQETVIAQNYHKRFENWNKDHKHYQWVKRIADYGGLILEIACGWGGGFAPLILDFDPNAKILMNDLGLIVLKEWQRFSEGLKKWPNISFAHFDATDCPLLSDSFDCVDSAGGIANISGSHLAIKEAFRILKPGGKLFMSDIDLDPESFVKFPKNVQEQWRAEMNDPDVGQGYEERLKKTGFEILSINSSRSSLDPNESTIAELAAKHGFIMNTIGFIIEARKPK